MNKIEIKIPKNLQELIGYLANSNYKTGIIAGGTDFMINFKKLPDRYNKIIDITGIKEFDYIIEDDESVRIGPIKTLAELSKDERIKKYFPALAMAASQVGSTQVRNRGTLSGNIANSSPCADTVPPLMAMGTVLKIIDGKGNITQKGVDDIIIGLGKNNLNHDEAIIEIIIPKPKKNTLSSFVKLGSRKAVTISKLNICVLVQYNEKTMIIEDTRVFVGSLGPKAFRSIIAEEALRGKEISKKIYEDFKNVLVKQVEEAIKGRTSMTYKRRAIMGVAEDALDIIFKDLTLDRSEKNNE